MKRIICVILASLIVLSCSVNAKAEGIDEETEENVMLTEVLKNTNQEEISQFPDEEYFDDTMDGFDFNEYPLLVQYKFPVAMLHETNWDTVKELGKARDKNEKQMVVLCEDTVFLRYYKSGSKFGVRDDYEEMPSYVQDILNGQRRQFILGEEVLITNVLSFMFRRAKEEVDVVYETDHGVFVRYYENKHAQAVEFRWEDYIPLAIAYQDYITSYEYNYAPDGTPKGGEAVSFLDYCQDPSKYVVTPASQQPDEQQEEPPEEKKNYTAVIVIASAVAVVAVATGAILVLRKKKR